MSHFSNPVQVPFASLPEEIQPVYASSAPGKAINLLTGDLTLEQSNQSIVGPGHVTWEWLSRPHIAICMESGSQALRIEFSDASIRTALFDLAVTIADRRLSQDLNAPVKSTIKARPTGVIEFGSLSELTHVVFHVANFWDFLGSPIRNKAGDRYRASRAVMRAEPWAVTIDAIDFGDETERFQTLLHDGSYAFTHVGQISRTDGCAFAIHDAESVIDALYWFLSFVRGNWTAPSLLVGFDEAQQRRGERWKDQKIYRWHNVRTWFNLHSAEGMTGLFPGIIQTWEDEIWHEPIRLAIHWYVETNNTAGGLEGSIVLQQAAFELLAWTLLVEDRKLLSADGFSKLPASDKLRLLLSECGIPLEISASLDALFDRAKSLGWSDGPDALVRTRNALVHPTPRKSKQILGRDDKCAEARYDTWCLSTWYLELVILHLLGYGGHYSNRLVRDGWRGREVEIVPWMKKSSGGVATPR